MYRAYLAADRLSHRRTQDFTMEGIHVVYGRAKGLENGSPPVGSRSKAPIGGLETKSPEDEAKNVKLVYNFQHFPVENLGFNVYMRIA